MWEGLSAFHCPGGSSWRRFCKFRPCVSVCSFLVLQRLRLFGGGSGRSVYELLADKNCTNPRRFVLLKDDRRAEQFLLSKGGVDRRRRALFVYGENPLVSSDRLPAGYEWREIDGEWLARIQGRVTPALFWQSPEAFLERGKGFCAVRGGDIAAWAFSAAVSDRQIDIGVETRPDHRRLGLAAAAAEKMAQYALEQGKAPVWACRCGNLASGKLAEKLGFFKISECSVLKKL